MSMKFTPSSTARRSTARLAPVARLAPDARPGELHRAVTEPNNRQISAEKEGAAPLCRKVLRLSSHVYLQKVERRFPPVSVVPESSKMEPQPKRHSSGRVTHAGRD
ncbi:hypothetical protein Misp02_62310 [Microtetraspora sp. NBRC 16547]|nr:hypothetical protein Misp02_62310 [Microtetraspora sp. NBRC 16547]